MLSAELRRERVKARPNAARIARLRAERLAIKERVGRHLAPGTATIFRAVLFRLLGRSSINRRDERDRHQP
jgi:hypothetical protein